MFKTAKTEKNQHECIGIQLLPLYVTHNRRYVLVGSVTLYLVLQDKSAEVYSASIT